MFTISYVNFLFLQGMLAAGIFVDIDKIESFGGDSRGIIHGGGFRLLGLQTLACACLMVWSMSVTFVMLFVSEFFPPHIVQKMCSTINVFKSYSFEYFSTPGNQMWGM